MLPHVTIEGRVVADPELRFAPSGMAVGRMRLVASSRKKNEQGEWEDDKTLWITATYFKQLAENVAESLRKGDLVVVTGRLQTDEWENEQGEKRSQIVVIADSVSASLMFRTIMHGQSERVSRENSPAGLPQSDEPPF